MTRAWFRVTLLPMCGLFSAMAVGSAGGQSFTSLCDCPSFVDIVGTVAGVPDTLGTFCVRAHDLGNNPLPGQPVTIDFGACTDLAICRAQLPGDIVDCPTHTITATTNAAGVVCFTVVGAAKNWPAPVSGPGSNSIVVQVAGITCAHATAVVYDESGAATAGVKGVDVSDLRSLLADWGSGIYYGRSDFNHDGPPLSSLDLRAWLVRWGTGTSNDGCATTYCP